VNKISRKKQMMIKVDEAVQLLSSLDTEEANEIANNLKFLYSEIVSKNYGLVFEKQVEEIDKILENNIPFLAEEKTKRITNVKEGFNYILEGDNLAALNILKKTHKENIQVIYIDPPYNRGKQDFIYDDKYINEDDTFKHSKWLSFMEKRLLTAWELLSDDGVIFVSIDDNEFAQLKMLMDSIFDDQNYVGCLPRVTKKSGKSTTTFSKNHDYLLIYVKKSSNVFVMKEHIDDGFKYKDEHFDTRGPYKLNQTLDYNTLGYVHSLDFPIKINDRVFYPGKVSKEGFLERKKDNPKDGFRWRWSKDLVDFGSENDWIVINESTGRIYTKTYLSATIKKKNGVYNIEYFVRKKPMSTLELIENKYSNDNARKELDKFKLEAKFDYPKPSSLIKRLLQTYYDKNATVLDFFAGSGTTGQAVAELNNEDYGNRKFILCTNNENDICEDITYPRVSQVVRNNKSNLRFYKIQFLEIKNRMYLEYSDKLLSHMKELVEFQYGFIWSSDSKYKLLISEDELEEFIDAIVKNKYEKVFIGNNILLSAFNKQKILENNIDLYIIPDYYYRDY